MLPQLALCRDSSNVQDQRNAAIAKEADPEGRAHPAVALVNYLVKRELLELGGSPVPVVRAIFKLLQEPGEDVGSQLEDALLDLDEVEELYADTDQLTKIVLANDPLLEN